jgi:hypothetical protein
MLSFHLPNLNQSRYDSIRAMLSTTSATASSKGTGGKF